MIHPDSRTLAWIEQAASDNHVRDIALVEKTIRAFSLLEALVRSECLPIESPFLKTEGEPVMVNLPSYQDMLGDKLTAFAPHTTGIPFFKGEKDCSMEINKQLFDIASLFDLTDNLTITAETFRRFAAIELSYQNADPTRLQDVLDDIFSTSRCICLRGMERPEEYKLLQGGISKVRSFIHGERNYSLDGRYC